MAAPSAMATNIGVNSLLDTDLYKLTMQCCILKYFPKTEVVFEFTNRTPHLKFNEAAVEWIRSQIRHLAELQLTADELNYLKRHCPHLNAEYLSYLQKFRFRPADQVEVVFTPDSGGHQIGQLQLHIKGLWVETTLYEIPLLAIVSEAYFRFCDTNWTHDGQLAAARVKGEQLEDGDCSFTEFGTRRRRDYRTQEMVMEGLKASGTFGGTSNVHFAMKMNLKPIGTVAHEWFMGIAAVTGDYEDANEVALKYWVETFGPGVMGIALTDTFGTRNFLEAFKKPVPNDPQKRTFAQVFPGVRQDSGDPLEFVRVMRRFYDEQGITDQKTIVFSDSLNVGKCLKYRTVAEKLGFQSSFGIGTFLTNDFIDTTTGDKSVPLNIVIKLKSAGSHPAVKISDNIGKNTGDQSTVDDVKRRLGYTERGWVDGDESHRWG